MVRARLSLQTAPKVEPVELADAKLHLRVDSTDDDSLITRYLSAARERVEVITGRQLITATYTLALDGFPGYTPFDLNRPVALEYSSLLWGSTYVETHHFIDVPRPPLQSVTAITYIDTTGVQQTWDPTQYQVSAPSGPMAERGRIRPAYGLSWPVARDQMGAVSVTFKAGYGDLWNAVPNTLAAAVLLVLGDLYFNRVNEPTQETLWRVERLVVPYIARPIARAA